MSIVFSLAEDGQLKVVETTLEVSRKTTIEYTVDRQKKIEELNFAKSSINIRIENDQAAITNIDEMINTINQL